MSAMSTRKHPRSPRQSSERRQARACKRVALKAIYAGDENRAYHMFDLADYWQARAMVNVDKNHAVDGAAIRVEV